MSRSERREFTKEQKRHMLRRAMRGNAVHCEGCGMDLTGKAFEFDHIVPEGLVVDKARPLTIDDGQLLGEDCCHRAPGGKTPQDMARITKARAVEAKSIRSRKSQIRSGGFPKKQKVRWRSAAELARMGIAGDQP